MGGKGQGGCLWEREKKEEDVIANKYLLLKHVLPMSMLELIAGVARFVAGVGMTPSFWSPSAQ